MNTYETNGNQVTGNRYQLTTYQKKQLNPSIEEVDNLADELANEYNNPDFRTWYCLLINQFGADEVRRWQALVRTGNYPARLFSYYAKQATNLHGAYEPKRKALPPQSTPQPSRDVIPNDDEVDTFTPERFRVKLDDALLERNSPPIQRREFS